MYEPMQKVKISKKQAEAIEFLLNTKESKITEGATDWDREGIIIAHCQSNKGWYEQASPLNHMCKRRLINALYIGYEVEKPKLKEGDWVTTPDGIVGILKKVPTNDVPNNLYVDCIGYRKAERPKMSELKHSTPEEIAEEKTRRWWAKHDRDVWELREKDALIHKSGGKILSVFKVEEDGVRFTYGGIIIREPFIYNYKIVSFAEDRKDA